MMWGSVWVSPCTRVCVCVYHIMFMVAQWPSHHHLILLLYYLHSSVFNTQPCTHCGGGGVVICMKLNKSRTLFKRISAEYIDHRSIDLCSDLSISFFHLLMTKTSAHKRKISWISNPVLMNIFLVFNYFICSRFLKFWIREDQMY